MLLPRSEAVLIAGATETVYTRAGCGKPVLMLFPEGGVDPMIFPQLATRARVLQPVRPAAVYARRGYAFHAWLRDFTEGLGLDHATLVADTPLAASAMAFAVREPDRVNALAVLRRSAAPMSRRFEALAAQLNGSACVLRVIAVDPHETADRAAHVLVASIQALLSDLETRSGG